MAYKVHLEYLAHKDQSDLLVNQDRMVCQAQMVEMDDQDCLDHQDPRELLLRFLVVDL